ncbi:MAG: ATP-binding cassette domain-containing protein, partial [Cellvibrionaceae bacterium]|nr:ATP-binding cassette domain-containing protein [Cellvibrionaceae bacterium]
MSDQLRFKFKLHGGARPRLALEAVLPGRGIIGVLGESGSGKTTLLRCLAGLERAEGELYLGDECWQSAKTFKPSHKRSLAYVFQEASLLPHLSAAQNIQY